MSRGRFYEPWLRGLAGGFRLFCIFGIGLLEPVVFVIRQEFLIERAEEVSGG